MWVTIDDIKGRWISDKPLPSDEKLEILIDDFEAQVANRFPDIEERLNNGSLALSFLVATISRWVIEYLQTDGTQYSSETQTMYGVGSRSVTIGSGSRNTNVLSEADFRTLLPRKSGRIFSVHMNTRPPAPNYNFWD